MENASSSNQESENDKDDIVDNNIGHDLSVWASSHVLSTACVRDLLKILRCHGHSDLPRDPRTLLQTPREISVETKFGGDYFYLGIERELAKKVQSNKGLDSRIRLTVNIDGMPLFKSSNKSLWPILGLIVDDKEECPFPIAIFYGVGKPNDCTGFLKDFLIEYRELITHGFTVNKVKYSIEIVSIICDAPARQYLKSIKAHNSYQGCERCEVQGEYIDKRMVFHSIDAPLRTTEKFKMLSYPNHQIGYSPFCDSKIDVLKCFPIDYMHLVLLGVTKRLLMSLKEGPKICKISNRQLERISQALESYKSKVPSEFARQPRGIDELKRWKATEFRQFLLYTGPLVLKSVIAEKCYIHFMSLSVAMRILLDTNDSIRNNLLAYAGELLEYFVKMAPNLYGNHFTTYNVHSLIHLKQDAQHFNTSLDNISTFPFENYLQTLKMYVKNAKNPVSQVVKRRCEIEIANNSRLKKQIYTSITPGGKDSWFILKSKNVIQIVSKIKHGEYKCNFFHHCHLEPLFQQPCLSTTVNIYKLRKKTKSLSKIVKICEFSRKLVSLKVESGDIALFTRC